MFCLLQSHVSHERQMPYYSQISFHSQYHAPLSARPSVKCKRECRSTLPVQLDWALTSQPIHINNEWWWWCLEHEIPHDPSDWKLLAVLLYYKLAGEWLSSPHSHGQWWGLENAWWGFGPFLLVSVVFLYPLLLGIWYRKETFVAGMPEMVEVVKNQDKRGGHTLFGYAGSATGVTSLTHLYTRSSSELCSSVRKTLFHWLK